MQKKQIDHFFRVLSEELDLATSVILTGAAAGALMGQVRPSMDIDFAIKSNFSHPSAWREIDKAIERTMKKTGIHAEFSEDIDRWGMISLLDYEKKAWFYKKFKNLRLLVMDPSYWAIGKMTRYIDPDIQDMVSVFKKQKTSWKKLIQVWSTALRKSPKSTTQQTFFKHVEHFFQSQGRKIWGKSFMTTQAIEFWNHQLHLK
ncbi:hypothetical protein BVX98_02550 [bacterium F11]|nr:hypothetical protein BVX98_02550 [bacterium F11]